MLIYTNLLDGRVLAQLPSPAAPGRPSGASPHCPTTSSPPNTPAAKTAAGTPTGAATPSPTATPKPGSATGQPPAGGVEGGTGANTTNPGATDVGVTGNSIKLGGIFMYGYALGNLAI